MSGQSVESPWYAPTTKARVRGDVSALPRLERRAASPTRDDVDLAEEEGAPQGELGTRTAPCRAGGLRPFGHTTRLTRTHSRIDEPINHCAGFQRKPFRRLDAANVALYVNRLARSARERALAGEQLEPSCGKWC